MLEEAIDVIRQLWRGGMQSHRGRHYSVENARIYDLPERRRRSSSRASGQVDSPGGPHRRRLLHGHARARGSRGFRERAAAGKPVTGGMKVCFEADEPPPALAPTASGRPTRSRASSRSCSRRPALRAGLRSSSTTSAWPRDSLRTRSRGHLDQFEQFDQAGFSEVYVQQVGSDLDGFFAAYEREILPRYAQGARRRAPRGVSLVRQRPRRWSPPRGLFNGDRQV